MQKIGSYLGEQLGGVIIALVGDHRCAVGGALDAGWQPTADRQDKGDEK